MSGKWLERYGENMKWIKRIFCRHTYLQSVSCNSERVGNDNYVYDYEHYELDIYYNSKAQNRKSNTSSSRYKSKLAIR